MPSKPNVNEGFTVDFSENRLYAIFSFSLFFPHLPGTVFLSLVYAHARAANHGTGRRVRESVFLAYYPFLRFSLAKGKEYEAEEKVPCLRILYVYVCVRARVSAGIVGICDV